jgi:hypothetical protein
MPSAHLSRSRDEVPGTVLRRRVSIKNPVASGDILANATSHSHAGETHGHRCPMLPFLPAGAWAAVAWAPPPPLRAPHRYGGQNGWMGTPHTHASDAVRSIRSRKWLCLVVWSCLRSLDSTRTAAILHEFYGISPIFLFCFTSSVCMRLISPQGVS